MLKTQRVLVRMILRGLTGLAALSLVSDLPRAWAIAWESRVDQLVAITNDRDAAIADLGLAIDAKGNVVSLLYVVRENGKVLSQKVFPIGQLATADGAVLEEERGVKAVSMHGTVNSQAGQSKMYIRFVANGMTGEFKTCAMHVVRSSPGVWRLLNPYSLKPITQAKMLTWALGFQTIEGICLKQ